MIILECITCIELLAWRIYSLFFLDWDVECERAVVSIAGGCLASVRLIALDDFVGSARVWNAENVQFANEALKKSSRDLEALIDDYSYSFERYQRGG